MSLRLVNNLILEHLRWFGYQLEARILEREFSVKPPNLKRSDSKLMNLLSKCVEKADDPQLYQVFEDQRAFNPNNANMNSGQSIGYTTKPLQKISRPRVPAKSVGQSYQSGPKPLPIQSDEDNFHYPPAEQSFYKDSGSNLINIANALRNKRNSVAPVIYDSSPRTHIHSHNPVHPLPSEASPKRNANFEPFPGSRESYGNENGFYQPPPNGFTDVNHIDNNQKHYPLKQENPTPYPAKQLPPPKKPANLRHNAVSSSYQTPPRALPYNTQSLNNSYLASLEPNYEQGYAIDNPYTGTKVPSRDTTAPKKRPTPPTEWNSNSISYTKNNFSPSSVRGVPDKIPLNNSYQNDPPINPIVSYPKSQTNNRSKLLGNNGGAIAVPSWRNQPSQKLGFTKEPSPFTKGSGKGDDMARSNDKRGPGNLVRAPKGAEPPMLDYLMAHTSFSENEIRSFYEAFLQVMGTLGLQPMDKQKFKEFASQTRNIYGDHFTECLFYFGSQLSMLDAGKNTIEFKEAVLVLDKLNYENPFNLMHFIFRLSTGEEYKEANMLLVETLLKEVKEANIHGRVLILLESLEYVYSDGRIGRSEFLSFEEYLEVVKGFEPMRKYC